MRIRFYRPLAPSKNTPDKYKMYMQCMGCYRRIIFGIEIKGEPSHFKCIFKTLDNQRKYQEYVEDQRKEYNEGV